MFLTSFSLKFGLHLTGTVGTSFSVNLCPNIDTCRCSLFLFLKYRLLPHHMYNIILITNYNSKYVIMCQLHSTFICINFCTCSIKQHIITRAYRLLAHDVVVHLEYLKYRTIAPESTYLLLTFLHFPGSQVVLLLSR